MKREILFTLDTPYRQPLEVEGFRFGEGNKSCAVVGALRGNEVQQMYVCARLVKALKTLEQQGAILHDREVLVVPCINHFSMNVGERFWPMDHTDINRMFPGYDLGETTQRIAAALFGAVQGYTYGIQLGSFYIPGNFVPHVRMMDLGYQSASLCNLFGLPYVVIQKPSPFDTTTLNYNWQVWESSAFSLCTQFTDRIDEAGAQQAVTAILRFLSRVGVLKYPCHNGYISMVIRDEELATVHTHVGGIFVPKKGPGDNVEQGEALAEILDPITAEVKEKITSPTPGIVFFAMQKPLCTEHAVAYRIIKKVYA